MDQNSKTYREGRRRLKELKGRARAQARRMDKAIFSPLSLLGQSLSDIVEEKHLDALVVYEDAPGAWYADLMLKGVPTGMPEVMGTPVADPRPTREEALKDAYMILVAVMRAIYEREIGGRDTKREDLRVFEIEGHGVQLPGSAIDEAKAAGDSLGISAVFSEDDAVAHFESILREVTGGETFEPRHYDDADETLRMRLIAGMAMMLIYGRFRYPQREREDSEADKTTKQT